MQATLRRLARLDVLLVTSGLWFLAKGVRYAFPPLFEPIMDLYGISESAIGLAFTGFMICYAIMQFPAGVIQDRIGPVRVMVGGAVATSVASIALVMESGFLMLVVLMLAMGVATGFHKTVAVPLLSRVYRRHTGRAFGVHETFGSGAGVVAPILAVFLLNRTGWRSFYLVAGVFGLTLAGIALVRIPPRLTSPVDATVDGDGSMRRYFELFGSSRITVYVVLTALFAFAYNGVVAFLPLYLTEISTLDNAAASGLYSLLFAVTLVQLVTGELSDRIGPLPMIGACILLGILGMSGLLLGSAIPVLVVSVLAFGIAGHGYRPVRDAYLTELIPEDAMGGGVGLIRSILMGAGAVAPGIVGVVADFVGFRPAFGVLTASLVLSIGALAYLVLTRP